MSADTPPAASLADEIGRLCALNRYGLRDSAPDPAFDEITGLVMAALDAPIALVSLLDADRQWFLSRQGFDATETPRSLAFCHHTIQGREVLCVPDATSDPRFRDNPLVTGPPWLRSYLGAPLVSPDGHNLGALSVLDVKPRDFTPRQRDLLTRCAALVVSQCELRQMSRVDHLSGFLSRSALLQALDTEMARCHRTFTTSSVAVIDVDETARFNRMFGPRTGDRIIKRVAAICSERLRAYDVIGRIAGDRFALIMPGAPVAGALAALGRICTQISRARIDGHPGLGFTVSVGATEFRDDFVEPLDWLRAAEAMLLRAKAAGKNRCMG